MPFLYLAQLRPCLVCFAWLTSDPSLSYMYCQTVVLQAPGQSVRMLKRLRVTPLRPTPPSAQDLSSGTCRGALPAWNKLAVVACRVVWFGCSPEGWGRHGGGGCEGWGCGGQYFPADTRQGRATMVGPGRRAEGARHLPGPPAASDCGHGRPELRKVQRPRGIVHILSPTPNTDTIGRHWCFLGRSCSWFLCG